MPSATAVCPSLLLLADLLMAQVPAWQWLLVWFIGLLAATQVNHAIYSLAWNRRPISPWSTWRLPLDGEPSRRGLQNQFNTTPSHRRLGDYLPIVGWIRLRREETIYGRAFWIRPLLIELLLPIGLAVLYAYELSDGLLPPGATAVPDWVQHSQFFAHSVLICLMAVATFIDLDEKTIPDEVTFPGTLIALTLAATLPRSLLPCWDRLAPPVQISTLWLTSPRPWPSETLDGLLGLAIAWACLAAWWYALLPKTLWYRQGAGKFLQYLVASVIRHRLTRPWTALMAGLAAVTAAVWSVGGIYWMGLLTALVGMATSGALVWAIRVVAGAILRQEAMGFGDVTLMAMIGAFLGWQTSLLVFFLAPFTGVLIAVIQFLVTGRKDIAYGPFLCSASLIVLIGWAEVWSAWGLPLFRLGWFVPIVLAFCLLLLAGLLLLLESFKRLFLR